MIKFCNKKSFVFRDEIESVLAGKPYVHLEGIAECDFLEALQELESTGDFYYSSYPQSKYGRETIHRIEQSSKPLRENDLDWHTEDSFSEQPPVLLFLYCTFGDPAISTKISKIEAKNRGEVRFAPVTSDPYLYTPGLVKELPLTWVDAHGKISFRYDPALIPESDEVLRICEIGSVTLASGDLLIVNNHIATHARDGDSSGVPRVLLRALANEK